MTFQNMINGPLGVSLIFSLAQSLTPRLGFWLADSLFYRYARQGRGSILAANRLCAPAAHYRGAGGGGNPHLARRSLPDVGV